jgi:ubiquinone/menaquinone biosynthesis C-methylase UbiE
VTSCSRPLFGAYRTDPGPPAPDEFAHESVTENVATDTFRRLQLDFYREAASHYDSWAGGANIRAAERLASFVDLQPGERVIDIGCGTGLVSRALGIEHSTLEHMGIDLSPDMITNARQQVGSARGVHFTVMDAQRLSFNDDMFDVAVLGQSLAYFEDPWQAFAEIRRVLRPGGRVAISCRCRSLSTPAQEVFFERLERLAIRRARTPAHHALFGEPWVLSDMLEMAGFTDIRGTQLLVGVRAADVHEWTEMMEWSGPWPHAMIGLLSPGARATFEEELDRTMHRLGEGDYAFHGAFTLATGRLRDPSPAQPSSESAPEETPEVSSVRSSLYASNSEPAFSAP